MIKDFFPNGRLFSSTRIYKSNIFITEYRSNGAEFSRYACVYCKDREKYSFLSEKDRYLIKLRNQEGISVFKHSDGDIQKQEYWEKGCAEGMHISFRNKAVLCYTNIYKKGLNKEYSTYFCNGILAQKTIYRKNKNTYCEVIFSYIEKVESSSTKLWILHKSAMMTAVLCNININPYYIIIRKTLNSKEKYIMIKIKILHAEEDYLWKYFMQMVLLVLLRKREKENIW